MDRVQDAVIRKAAATWRDLPVQDEQDRHADTFHEQMSSSGGVRVMAARVRGRHHRHEGRNCDDWYEMAQSGEWTIIAVADGAGSHPLSRVGAKASCRAAVETLSARLARLHTPDSIDADQDLPPTIAACLGFKTCLGMIKAIHQAVGAACTAVETACGERMEQEEYERRLGRKPCLSDFAATLSLLAFKPVTIDSVRYAAGWGYQIGDGVSAVIDPRGKATVLGLPDQGEYSNETLFLSREYLGSNELSRRIHKVFQPMRALVMMTDGVMESGHFPLPAEHGAEVLHAELVLNNIIPPPTVPVAEAAEQPSGSKVPPWDEFRRTADFHHQAESLQTEAGQVQQTFLFADSRLLADSLGLDHSEVIGSPELLALGAKRSAEMDREPPSSERLRNWLDRFPWRNCYDDRTLVVAFEEE